MRVRKIVSKQLLEVSELVFSHAVDATLSIVAYLVAFGDIQSQFSAPFHARIESEKFLRTVNYDAIKHALITASKNGFIKRKRHAMPEITKAGMKRLASVIPSYDEIRMWDKRLHIVTYDVPEKKKHTRDVLRMYLKKIGCAKLQASVWLTPYDPIDIIRQFIKEKEIEGTVIVSNLGIDASIGDETIQELVFRIYNLQGLEDRYREWLEKYEGESISVIGYKGFCEYLAILKDDPQLPFALLSKKWIGQRAYKIIKPIFSMLSFTRAAA